KPAPAPELVGESKPVPAFKGKAMNGSAKNLVLVGAIGGAFGVKGEVRLRAFTAAKDGIIAYGPLYDEEGKVLLRPKSWRELKDGVAVVAPEVKTREEAEAWRGKRLYVPRAHLPETAEDEFYIVDLLGCRAEALDGASLGEVVAVWNFGAGDVLEFKPPHGPNVRVTFTKQNVPLIDLAGRRVVFDPPPPEPPTGK
ncbi:MAG: ribosome maturation factor RimM, partial [Pseudomonadota bacterium]